MHSKLLTTFAVGSSAGLDKALVQAEVVSDTVPPRGRTGIVAVRLPLLHDLVDVAESQSLVGRRQDRRRDQRDVRLLKRFPAGGKVGRRMAVT